jgi:hypothetical protein
MYTIEIKPAAELTEEEHTQMAEIDRLAFAGQPGEDLEWSDSDWVVLGRMDGRLVSQLGIVCRNVRVGDTVVPVGGVGGVATHPDFVRRGFAGQNLTLTTDFLRDRLGVQFGLLICAPERTAYYGKFGWLSMTAPMYFEFKGGQRLFDAPVMILPLGSACWPDGAVDLCGKPW